VKLVVVMMNFDDEPHESKMRLQWQGLNNDRLAKSF